MNDVTDNIHLRRFELTKDRATAFVSYRQEKGQLVLIHTDVPRALEGQGLGSALVRAVLDEVRHRHQLVVPECAFIAGFIRRHPEYEDLVAQPREDRA
ncbi:GNAT family N-acetyltransferase [Acidisoma silvae]|uniref:N-acetyltransferase n=1 Tax=Acidisoma silvae TaxID=2802396 RepID=A0A963YUN0_9PROT|nr:GNAT family N-acetyltransferase [Acidisoma silvae]MCB8877386.1 N-acetyltransferase [Acidisoma silvae]